jgi:hypothetical protein
VVLVDTIVWVAVAVILLCLAIHYFPELRQAVQSIPAQADRAISDVKSWWHNK